MGNIFCVLLSLCLVGCVSKKEVANDNTVAIAINREDVMLPPSGEHPYKRSLDIKSAKDYKVPAVKYPAPATHSSTIAALPQPVQELPPGARDPQNGRLMDKKSPQARHEKMMESAGAPFAPPNASGYVNPRVLKK